MPLEGAVANITANSALAHLFQNTSLVIWDEAPNAPKAAFDAVDRCFRDILEGCPRRSAELPFGGMPMLLGGDFRQIPPVLRRVEADAIGAHTLKCCSFWGDDRHMKNYVLTRNKRAEGDETYAEFLLSVGNGTYVHPSDEPGVVEESQDTQIAGRHPASITLPAELLAPPSTDALQLAEWLYEDRHKEEPCFDEEALELSGSAALSLQQMTLRA